MADILITNSFPTQPIERQIPNQGASWCNHRFALHQSDEPIDAWVVYDDLVKMESNACHRSNTLLITAEPPSIRTYRNRYTSQFGCIRTSHKSILHSRSIKAHEAQPWHYGMYPCKAHAQVLDYDSLAQMRPPTKSKLLSVIASNKVTTEDHRQRLKFVEHLRAAFGDQVDVFGRGVRDVPDKADAIWDYQYHVVLENDHSEHYMSEKLPDGFLGWSFPFYSGGEYANHVFPEGSFARVDIYDPAKSIAIIRRHLTANDFHSKLPLIQQSRSIVLDELNLFAVLCKHFDTYRPSKRTTKRLTLQPKKRSIRLTFERFMRSLAIAS